MFEGKPGVELEGDAIEMGLRWWRQVLIRSHTKRYLDERWARKYWLISFGKVR